MSQIKTSKKTNNFVMLDKNCLIDKELSWQAKGLHSYIMSLPEGWKLYLADLENRSSDGRDCTASCLNELIAYGYAKRLRLQDEEGKFKGYDYTIFEEYQQEIRSVELPLYLEKISKRNKKKRDNKPERRKSENGNSVNGYSEYGKADTNDNTIEQGIKEINNKEEFIVASDTPAFPNPSIQGETNLETLELQKKNPTPQVPPPPPPLKTKAVSESPTKTVLAHFDSLIQKLGISYTYPKSNAAWKPIHTCCKQIYSEVGAEGLGNFFEKVEAMCISEVFPFKDKTSITPMLIGSVKVIGIIANYSLKANNSQETVQLSVLCNSGLKTLKIARKHKAYEIKENLVNKQTGIILNEGISQEDRQYIAWITKNIVARLNNNTIEQQDWFCGFVTPKTQ